MIIIEKYRGAEDEIDAIVSLPDLLTEMKNKEHRPIIDKAQVRRGKKRGAAVLLFN